jgi:hypothetical protein
MAKAKDILDAGSLKDRNDGMLKSLKAVKS